MRKRDAEAAAGSRVTVFHERTPALTLWLVVGSGAMLQGIATAAYFHSFAQDVVEGLRLVAIGLGAFLALVGLYFASHALSRMRGQGPPIVIGPDGLHDRAVTARPVRWRDLRDLAVLRARGAYVAFEIAPEAVDSVGVRPRRRIEAAFNRALGYPGYQVHMMGTDATIDRLVAAITPHASVLRRD